LLKIEFLPPFSILGNFFWDSIPFIQFYEFTGVCGGSLWVLTANSIFFYALKFDKKKLNILALFYIAVPAIMSLIYYNLPEKEENNNNKLKIILFHLNDKDKNAGDYTLMKKIKTMIKECINDTTNVLVILPENTLNQHNRLENLDRSLEFFYLKKFAEAYPDLSIIIGAEVLEQNPKLNSEFSKYNVAVYIDNAGYQIISKSFFVPFEEKTPSFLSAILSSTTYYQSKETKHCFEKNGIKIGVLICYDILYGFYAAKAVGSNSNFITVLTKEAGLYGNELSFSQYLGIIKIRAIEQRKYILKSSNTGYTSIINEKGKEVKTISPNSNTQFLINEIPLNEKKTVYSIFRDYVVFCSVILLIICFWFLRKRTTPTAFG
jgi:apolipoprotein N-acyltransferase